MIDWLTIILKFNHPRIENGRVIKMDENGVVLREFPTTRRFEGSFESSIAVSSNDVTSDRERANSLFIDGNFAKFLQGHNIVGTDDINVLTLGVVQKLCESLDIQLDELAKMRIKNGDYVVKRIDITHYLEFKNKVDADQFLDAITKKSRTRSGRATRTKGTVYFNKTSKRWAVKYYSKYDEITQGGKGHTLNPHFYDTPLIDWVHNKTRCELVLRRLELKKIAQAVNQYAEDIKASQLTPRVLQELYEQYIGKVDMNTQMVQSDKKEDLLPKPSLAAYLVWKSGRDLQNVYSRAQFYRHRKNIKNHLGIDVLLPPVDTDDACYNVVPLQKVVQGNIAKIPQQFYDLKLIYSAN